MADLKKLRVCLSKDLPAVTSRSSDYIYFAYDKLALYCGSSTIDENFAIASDIPEFPVPGMIYILESDGSVHRQVDYVDQQIAEIEDESQIEILQKAGTVFYSNANNRYLDSQQRTLVLPFNDGTYELNVSMMNDQQFTKDTILKYNEDHERFEVYGPKSEEFIDYSKPLRGGETSSVKMVIDNGRLKGIIKICQSYDNLIKLASDGLYVKVSDKVSYDDYSTWKKDIDDFKKYAQNVLDNINAEIISLEELITPEAIKERSMEVLKTKYPTIETALENYQSFVDKLDDISTELLEYASTNINKEVEKIDSEMSINSNWNELDDAATTYTREIDYYKYAEEWLMPAITKRKLKLLLSAAAEYYIIDES